MTRSRTSLAAVLLVLLVLSCGGDSPTSPTTCDDSLGGTSRWVISGGCRGASSSVQSGTAELQYNAASCAFTIDITPPAEKAKGGVWVLSANLRQGTASVTRSNVSCAAVDTGTVRTSGGSIIADLGGPPESGACCELVYTVNVAK